MRSQLAVLVKQLIERVRRRTSRKQRSIAFVVRVFLQSSGQASNVSNCSRSRSRHVTPLGAWGCHAFFQDVQR